MLRPCAGTDFGQAPRFAQVKQRKRKGRYVDFTQPFRAGLRCAAPTVLLTNLGRSSGPGYGMPRPRRSMGTRELGRARIEPGVSTVLIENHPKGCRTYGAEWEEAEPVVRECSLAQLRR